MYVFISVYLYVCINNHNNNNNNNYDNNNNTKLIPPLSTSLKGAMQINKVYKCMCTLICMPMCIYFVYNVT